MVFPVPRVRTFCCFCMPRRVLPRRLPGRREATNSYGLLQKRCSGVFPGAPRRGTWWRRAPAGGTGGRKMCPPRASGSSGGRLEQASAPGLIQPLLERAPLDRFLLPGVAIAGAADLPVVEQLAQFREREFVIVRRRLRNGLQGLGREPMRA